MEQIFVTFLVVFALFFANSTTVLVALVAKPLVLPTQWSHLQKIVHKPLESDLNFSKTLLQCSNVTVSCVKYHFLQMPRLRSRGPHTWWQPKIWYAYLKVTFVECNYWSKQALNSHISGLVYRNGQGTHGLLHIHEGKLRCGKKGDCFYCAIFLWST